MLEVDIYKLRLLVWILYETYESLIRKFRYRAGELAQLKVKAQYSAYQRLPTARCAACNCGLQWSNRTQGKKVFPNALTLVFPKTTTKINVWYHKSS